MSNSKLNKIIIDDNSYSAPMFMVNLGDKEFDAAVKVIYNSLNYSYMTPENLYLTEVNNSKTNNELRINVTHNRDNPFAEFSSLLKVINNSNAWEYADGFCLRATKDIEEYINLDEDKIVLAAKDDKSNSINKFFVVSKRILDDSKYPVIEQFTNDYYKVDQGKGYYLNVYNREEYWYRVRSLLTQTMQGRIYY